MITDDFMFAKICTHKNMKRPDQINSTGVVPRLAFRYFTAELTTSTHINGD